MNFQSIIYCILLVFSFYAPAIEDAIYLSSGFDSDHTLDPELKDKNLEFKGTYYKLTSLVYDKNSHSIRFSPKKNGVATLHIKEGKKILKKYTIIIKKTDLQRVAYELRSLLKEVDGITIKLLNNKVTIDGEILSPKDMKRIHQVVKEYKGQAVSLVTLSVSAQNKVARFIEREIGNPNITVKATNERFILKGTVSSENEKKQAEIIATLYLPSSVSNRPKGEGGVEVKDWVTRPIINLIVVQKPPAPDKRQNKLVQLVIHYVELEKGYDDMFRFQWSPGVSEQSNFNYSNSAVAGVVFTLAGTVSNLFPKLNWAKSFGFARTLHSSNLIVEEGKKGVIRSEKDIPFRSSNESAAPATAKVGISGSFTPTIVGSRKDGVRLTTEIQINNLIGTNGGNPIVAKRAINTVIYVRSGLSAAIGGIVSTTNSKDYNRSPQSELQGADPLFNIISSKSFIRNNNQFVVFVTPIIKSSASTGVEEVKRKFRVN